MRNILNYSLFLAGCRLKARDRVKLVSSARGDGGNSPVWGGKYGRIKGEVIWNFEADTYGIQVRWDNGKED